MQMLSKFRQASDYYLGKKVEIKISSKVDDHFVLTEGPAVYTVAKFNVTKNKSWRETPGFFGTLSGNSRKKRHSDTLGRKGVKFFAFSNV